MDMLVLESKDIIVTKSPNDKKDYKVVKLSNGLTALLISDLANTKDDDDDCDNSDATEQEKVEECKNRGSVKRRRESENDDVHDEEEEMEEDLEDAGDGEVEADGEFKSKKPPKKQSKMAAAALCVGIGSFSDPEDIPGLAHFLEHMVFMGSEKYPDENSFDAFIKKHGGSDNASTGFDRTVFQFEVYQKHFHEGLIRFAQFFVAPLLKRDSTDRELEAVDSEFQMSLHNDYHRKQQLMSVMCKEGHPMAKFTWGNSKSLKDDPASNKINVHQRLREFRDRMYSAHYMTLVLQSRESLEVLEQWTNEAFSDIPNNCLEQPHFGECGQPFQPDKFCKLYKMVPVQDLHQMDVMWSLPCLQKHYRCKPLHYLSWLMGHEGAGSILAVLKKRAWALRLYCGNSETSTEHNETYAAFAFTIVLTDKGLDHVDEVLVVIFQYINMLDKEGPQKRIFEEIKTIDDNNFRFLEEDEPIDNVECVSEHMHLYPAEEYLTGSLIQTDYNEELIQKCMGQLTPESANIVISSKKFDGKADREESWFGTEYSVQEIPSDWMAKMKNARLNHALHLPTPNRFIAKDFDLKEPDITDTDYPSCILDTEHGKLWYKRDTKFCIPRAYICFHLMTPLVNLSPHHAVTFDLFTSMLEHQLSETAYEAEAAELDYSLKAMETGLEVKMSGFNDKLPLLFETIIDFIASFTVTEDMFRAIKENIKNSYHNYILKPSKVNRDLRLAILQEVKWTAMDKDRVIDTVTMNDVTNMAKTFCSRLYIEGLVQGNFTSKEAKSMDVYLQQKLNFQPIPKDELPSTRVLEMPPGCNTLRWKAFNQSDTNTVVTNYFQTGPGTISSLGLVGALMMMMEEPCFDILRTQEQLGYSVYASRRNSFGILGFIVSVTTQASKFSACHVDACMDAFLQTFKEQLAKTSEEDFKMQIEGLVNIMLCEDPHLGEEVDRNWGYIMNQEYVFDRLHREVDALRLLTLDDVRKFLQDHSPTGDKVHKLSIQVIGYGECEKNNPPDDQRVDDVTNKPANQNADETDSANQRPPSSHMDQLESRHVILDEGVTGTCITDIRTFKQDLFVHPVTKIDH